MPILFKPWNYNISILCICFLVCNPLLILSNHHPLHNSLLIKHRLSQNTLPNQSTCCFTSGRLLSRCSFQRGFLFFFITSFNYFIAKLIYFQFRKELVLKLNLISKIVLSFVYIFHHNLSKLCLIRTLDDRAIRFYNWHLILNLHHCLKVTVIFIIWLIYSRTYIFIHRHNASTISYWSFSTLHSKIFSFLSNSLPSISLIAFVSNQHIFAYCCLIISTQIK